MTCIENDKITSDIYNGLKYHNIGNFIICIDSENHATSKVTYLYS